MKLCKGTLKNGFEYEVDVDKFESMRFMDVMCEIENNPFAFSKAIKMIFGTEQRDRLYDYLDEKGLSSTAQDFDGFIEEIYENHKEIKN